MVVCHVRARILGYCMLVIGAVLVIHRLALSHQGIHVYGVVTNQHRPVVYSPSNGCTVPTVPIILAYTSFFGQPLSGRLEGTHACPHTPCLVTDDRSLLHNASALLFHLRDMDTTNDLPPHSRSDLPFVFFSSESPDNAGHNPTADLSVVPAHYFNWSMSYRRDSDCFRPYGGVQERAVPPTSAELKQYRHNMRTLATNKTKLVVWMNSNCYTASQREKVVLQLQTLIKVDIWGFCGDETACPKSLGAVCDQRISDQYKFFLAFENSICADYITEKLWHRWQLSSVPIVLSRKLTRGLLPDRAFIAVDDFSNVQQLADHLLYLHQNINAYLSYFEWKPYYEAMHWSTQGFCCLCQKIRSCPPPKTIPDINKWWRHEANCSYMSSFKTQSKPLLM